MSLQQRGSEGMNIEYQLICSLNSTSCAEEEIQKRKKS